jgi:hypothetical protein
MLRTSMALGLIACSSPPAPRDPEPSPPVDAAPVDAEPFSLPGEYSNQHTIMVVCDQPDWCEQEVSDRLAIRDAGAGAPGVEAIDVEIELVQTNAHTCGFQGKLQKVLGAEPARYVHESAEGDDDHPCVLTLTLGPTELELGSEGCRYHCGARAYLETTFSYN